MKQGSAMSYSRFVISRSKEPDLSVLGISIGSVKNNKLKLEAFITIDNQLVISRASRSADGNQATVSSLFRSTEFNKTILKSTLRRKDLTVGVSDELVDGFVDIVIEKITGSTISIEDINGMLLRNSHKDGLQVFLNVSIYDAILINDIMKDGVAQRRQDDPNKYIKGAVFKRSDFGSISVQTVTSFTYTKPSKNSPGSIETKSSVTVYGARLLETQKKAKNSFSDQFYWSDQEIIDMLTNPPTKMIGDRLAFGSDYYIQDDTNNGFLISGSLLAMISLNQRQQLEHGELTWRIFRTFDYDFILQKKYSDGSYKALCFTKPHELVEYLGYSDEAKKLYQQAAIDATVRL